jgi:NADH-quinone oxidoreductase subunit E
MIFIEGDGFMVEEIVNRHGIAEDKLMPILLDIQNSNDKHYLSEDDLKQVSRLLGIPESRVYSVATFYSFFSLQPRGKYIIQVCDNAPCIVNGAYNVIDDFRHILGIDMGQTTPDDLFTLEYSSCLGCCSHAPAARIAGELYGDLDSEKIKSILSDLRRR